MHGIHKLEAGSLRSIALQVILVRRHLGNSWTGHISKRDLFRCAARSVEPAGQPKLSPKLRMSRGSMALLALTNVCDTWATVPS